MKNSIIINMKDNVAVALEPLDEGSHGKYANSEITGCTDILELIPRYHKFAISNIAKGQPIIKYGEHIGEANQDIIMGTHVHTHNVAMCKRENFCFK